MYGQICICTYIRMRVNSCAGTLHAYRVYACKQTQTQTQTQAHMHTGAQVRTHRGTQNTRIDHTQRHTKAGTQDTGTYTYGERGAGAVTIWNVHVLA